MTPVNLSSVMIGNGITDYFKMTLSYYDMMCTAASVAPILDIETCVGIKRTVSTCKLFCLVYNASQDGSMREMDARILH